MADETVSVKVSSMCGSSEHIEPSMLSGAESFLGIRIQYVELLEGGDEAHVVKVDSKIGMFVLHASPPWRTASELSWVHALAQHAYEKNKEVVIPIEREGRTLFPCNGRFVAVYPFVSGQFLDRDSAALRESAATLLANIHNTLLDFRGGSRPIPESLRPIPPIDPDALHDRTLDAWWFSKKNPDWTIGPTHGDYYRGNLICNSDRIVGIIDWHEASVRPLALELAQATFELCHDTEHKLRLDRAQEFVTSYRNAADPVPAHELTWLLPLIRVWIRDDVCGSLADGSDLADNYVVKQIRAFRRLATESWVPEV